MPPSKKSSTPLKKPTTNTNDKFIPGSQRLCQICQAPFVAISSRFVNCDAHKGYLLRPCKTCGTIFSTKGSGGKGKRYCNPSCRPKREASQNMELLHAKGRERVATPKQCEICGADFYPPKSHAHCQKYCDKHKYSALRKHVIESDQKNPYKAGTIKQCEATEKHPDCSGTMMVFANEWTRCVHCAKMLNGQSASIKNVKDF